MTNVVIIGGGPGGYEAALVGRQLGGNVTLVERRGLGGSAVLTDVVPSKTLIAAAEVMSKIRAGSQVEILDEDLKKYAEEASKAAKAYQENKQKQLDQGGTMVPAAGDDSGSGKGDLQIPAQ